MKIKFGIVFATILVMLLGFGPSSLLAKTAKRTVQSKASDPLNLAVAFSDAWTFTTLSDSPKLKKVLFYPKGQLLRQASDRIEEIRMPRPKHFKMDTFVQHLSNSWVESECRPVEAGDFRYPVVKAENKKYERRYLGMRCRKEKLVKVIQVFDAGKDIYALTFWSKQHNWADQQFRSMNNFLMNRAHLCPASKTEACNQELQKKMVPSEFDNVGKASDRWPGKRLPKAAYIL